MKLRELKHEEATVWPPQRVDSIGPGDHPVEDGVLEGVERFGRRLLVRINIHGHRCTTRLQWDPPPTVGDVEVMLLASIGAQIRDLGDRELPARAGGTH